MQEFEKRRTLRRLWMERPPDKRTERDLEIFHEWIAENFPSLFKGLGRDTFGEMKASLDGLYDAAA
jgi:hypothetical protein